MNWTRLVQDMREVRNAYRSSAGNPEGMRPFVKGRGKWDNDIKVKSKLICYIKLA